MSEVNLNELIDDVYINIETGNTLQAAELIGEAYLQGGITLEERIEILQDVRDEYGIELEVL